MFEFLIQPFKLRYSKDREYYIILKNLFGIFPNNIELYKLALIHKSASLFLDDGTVINNERLEFLGDAILESIVSDFLFIEFPHSDEGFMTQIRSKIVSRTNLNSLSKDIGLDHYILAQSGGNYTQKHIYGDALEAMIGAIYLDKGYDFVNRLVINDLLRKNMNIDLLTSIETDFKSRLLEWSQKNKKELIFLTKHGLNYTAQQPHFSSEVSISGEVIAVGEGPSKKEAEQCAAHNATIYLNSIEDELGV